MKNLFIFPLSFVLCTTLCLSQNTIRVPQDQPTIQAGINAALPGDTVLVDEGNYKENLVIVKKILLGSRYIVDSDTSHISRTILDGSAPRHSDSAAVITIDGTTDTTTIITGFTITGGTGNKRNVISGSTVYAYRLGMAIDIAGGGARVSHNIIKQNNCSSALRMGGVINVWDVMDLYGISFAIIEENQIVDNVLQSTTNVEGHALAIGHNSLIRNNLIARNTSNGTSYSCGSQVWAGNVTFECNRIVDNSAKIGAGLQLIRSSGNPYYILKNNLFVRNTAANDGGAVYIGTGCIVTVVNNTFTQNSAGDLGSGIFVAGTALTVSKVIGINNIFWNLGEAVSEIYGADFESFHHNLIRGITTIGVNNFSADPNFAADGSFQLSAESPCIGAGVGSMTVLGILLSAPSMDMMGRIRPNPSGSAPDLGALEEASSTTSTERSNRARIHNFVYGGLKRWYSVVLPLNRETELKRPLMIYLQSYNTALDHEVNSFKLYQNADVRGFIFVFPAAYQRRWNSGLTRGTSFPTPSVDDVGFLRAVIDSICTLYSVDTNKIFVSGFSNGGFMAYRLASSLEHRLAGIVAVGSRLPESTVGLFSGTARIPVMIVHGTADNVVSYSVEYPEWRTVEATVLFWQNRNGALTEDQATQIDIDPNDLSSVTKYVYGTALPPNSRNIRPSVRFYKITNGGHEWPGSPAYYGSSVINRDINVNEEIFDFLDNVTVSMTEGDDGRIPSTLVLEQNYPNPFNPTTVITYNLPFTIHHSLAVYDLLGCKVAVLVNEQKPAGSYSVTWDAKGMASGIYFYTLTAGTFRETRRMVLVK